MKKNDIVEIEITGTTDEGMGVGRADGIAVLTFKNKLIAIVNVENKIAKASKVFI